jgi:hypothetical protein
MREQTPVQAQWFAYRTEVWLGSTRPARTWLVWAAVGVVACGAGAAIYGAFLWLVSLDAESAVLSLGDLSRVLGLFPN